MLAACTPMNTGLSAPDQDRSWRVHQATSSLSNLPAKPGIYVVGHDERFEGLETARTYVYVGQSRNLRRRVEEHTVLKEENPDLREYLRKNQYRAKFWFTTEIGEGANSLTRLERRLIRRFDPEFNTQLTGGSSGSQRRGA